MSTLLLPKIHILTEFKEGPYGGGNQFLKGLRQQWRQSGHYAETAEEASHILYNSYQHLSTTVDLKKKFQEKVFVHRLGPIFHYHRGPRWKKTDQSVIATAKKIADLVIFQSHWSYAQSRALGFDKKNYVIIGNGTDPLIFNKESRSAFNPSHIKLVAASWSDNLNKGFSFFQYLDQHLDFSRYTMTFIGNSPIQFAHIKSRPPMDSAKIAQELKQADIFIAPFKDEAASNSILEALACGLPVIALNSGGNSEEVKEGGELFNSPEEMMAKIVQITQNYQSYQKRIQFVTIPEVAQRYQKELLNIGHSSKNRPPWWFPHYLKWKLKTTH